MDAGLKPRWGGSQPAGQRDYVRSSTVPSLVPCDTSHVSRGGREPHSAGGARAPMNGSVNWTSSLKVGTPSAPLPTRAAAAEAATARREGGLVLPPQHPPKASREEPPQPCHHGVGATPLARVLLWALETLLALMAVQLWRRARTDSPKLFCLPSLLQLGVPASQAGSLPLSRAMAAAAGRQRRSVSALPPWRRRWALPAAV